MGRTKQLVPWPTPGGDKPLVAAAYDVICHVCSQMVVVLGHEADAVAAALAGRPFHPVRIDPDAPLFDSIRAGLATAQAIDSQAAILLQPGDHPQAAEATLTALLAAAAGGPDRAIIPQHAGRGGHPIVIPPPIAALLLSAECPNGLARYWSDHPELCLRLPVDDPGVVLNIDTPAQLKRS
jgi:molybdenum cofactor cytidylyltransferase